MPGNHQVTGSLNSGMHQGMTGGHPGTMQHHPGYQHAHTLMPGTQLHEDLSLQAKSITQQYAAMEHHQPMGGAVAFTLGPTHEDSRPHVSDVEFQRPPAGAQNSAVVDGTKHKDEKRSKSISSKDRPTAILKDAQANLSSQEVTPQTSPKLHHKQLPVSSLVSNNPLQHVQQPKAIHQQPLTPSLAGHSTVFQPVGLQPGHITSMAMPNAQAGVQQIPTAQPGVQMQAAQAGVQLQSAQPGVQLPPAQPGVQLPPAQPGAMPNQASILSAQLSSLGNMIPVNNLMTPQSAHVGNMTAGMMPAPPAHMGNVAPLPQTNVPAISGQIVPGAGLHMQQPGPAPYTGQQPNTAVPNRNITAPGNLQQLQLLQQQILTAQPIGSMYLPQPSSQPAAGPGGINPSLTAPQGINQLGAQSALQTPTQQVRPATPQTFHPVQHGVPPPAQLPR